MVDVKDLMQGNLIIFHDDSKDIVRAEYFFKEEDVWFIEWSMVKGTSDFKSGNSWIGEFKYIPLTASILIGCGFEREERKDWGNDSFFVWNKNGIDIHENWDGKEFLYATYVKGESRSFKGGIQIKTVHHLQNLYHSLCLAQLPIKF